MAKPYPQVRQTTFTLEELSRRADPEWVRDRNYITAYNFTGRSFTDHRDRAYDYTPPEVRSLAGDEAGNFRVLAGDEAGNGRKVA